MSGLPVTRRTLATSALILAALLLSGATEPAVRVAPMDSVGPRLVEKQTQTSVVRDYLRAWETLDSALQKNRPDVLDEYFVGTAKEKLADTIREQQNSGIQTAYGNQSHDLQVVFYSPEGLSIEIVDNAGYEVEVRDQGKVVGTKHVQAKYVAVLTPTESKWKVRVLQGGSQ
jgi:hypothetical protein